MGNIFGKYCYFFCGFIYPNYGSSKSNKKKMPSSRFRSKKYIEPSSDENEISKQALAPVLYRLHMSSNDKRPNPLLLPFVLAGLDERGSQIKSDISQKEQWMNRVASNSLARHSDAEQGLTRLPMSSLYYSNDDSNVDQLSDTIVSRNIVDKCTDSVVTIYKQ